MLAFLEERCIVIGNCRLPCNGSQQLEVCGIKGILAIKTLHCHCANDPILGDHWHAQPGLGRALFRGERMLMQKLFNGVRQQLRLPGAHQIACQPLIQPEDKRPLALSLLDAEQYANQCRIGIVQGDVKTPAVQ